MKKLVEVNFSIRVHHEKKTLDVIVCWQVKADELEDVVADTLHNDLDGNGQTQVMNVYFTARLRPDPLTYLLN